MRPLLEEIIAELDRLLKENKSIRNKVLLEQAVSSIKEYKRLTEKKMI